MAARRRRNPFTGRVTYVPVEPKGPLRRRFARDPAPGAVDLRA